MSDITLTLLLLCLTALAAGAINSVAGGGTLLTFPTLLHIMDGVNANATSTVALLPGSLAGSVGYRKELQSCRKLVLLLIAPSIVGGIVGSLLVTRLPSSFFSRLVPWLILTAAFLFLIQGPVKRCLGAGSHGQPNPITRVAVVLGQLLIAVYGGYFGAGIGILMLSVLPFMGTRTIHETNAAKTVLAALINAVTVVVFIVEGVVKWQFALPMAVAAIVGGYVGARFARRLPDIYVRTVVIAIGFSIGTYYLWRQFAGQA